MKKDDWITPAEALALLDVKRQTLYAYVSRGLVRAVADGADPRRSLYSRRDVEALAARRRRPRARAAIAAGTIRWGEPVLESAVSSLRDGDLYFGDVSARDLARSATLEETALHHWKAGDAGAAATGRFVSPRRPAPSGLTPLARCLSFLAAEAAVAPPALRRARPVLAPEAAMLVSGFADAAIGRRRAGPIHRRLAQSFGAPDAAEGIRAALVLLSDHELNASTFAARVAASAGASLAAAALAGLAVLTGPRHGGATLEAYRFVQDATGPGGPASALARRAALDPYEFGFGHPLYPDGDPRAEEILRGSRHRSPARQAAAATTELLGRPPNVDMALAVLAHDADLPPDAPFTIFATARMTGWIAHAMEQAESGTLIRPRATRPVQARPA